MSDTDSIQHIRQRLAHLRHSIRATLVAHGLSHIVVALVAFVLLSLLIDYSTHMDVPQRGVLLSLGIIGLGYLAYGRLLRPFLYPLTDDALAMEVETRHRELSDSLLNAVQFADGNGAINNASPAMVRRTIREGVEAADKLTWRDMLDKRKRNLRLGGAFGAMAILLLMVTFLPSTMSLWFQRNILLQQVDWPRETTLTIRGVDGNEVTVPEGGDLPIEIMASSTGVVPREVIVQSSASDGSSIKKRSLAQTNENIFRTVYKNVTDPFQFRVRGNDHTTRWHTVTPLPRPGLSDLTLALHPPAYTQEENRILPPGQSAYYFLKGSSLTIQGQSKKALQRVELWHNDKKQRTLEPNSGDHFETTIPSGKLKAGEYGIILVDTKGIQNRRPVSFVLRQQPDQKPDIQAKLTGIGNMVLTKAIVPVTSRIKDDFGISDAWIETRVQKEKGEHTKHKFAPEDLIGKLEENTTEVDYLAHIPMQELTVTPDNTVMLRVWAQDNDTVSGPKKGNSPTITLRVVTEEKLRSVLQTREQTLHQQFRRMIQDQEEMLERCRIVHSRINEKNEVTEELKQNISDLEQSQHKMARRALDVSAQFSTMVDTIRNNRLEEPGGPMQSRLVQKIITPVERLATELNPPATKRFKSALASTKQVSKCLESLTEARSLQNKILQRMRQIQEDMARSETIREAIKLLRDILRKQKKLEEKTKDKQEESEESIFED